MFVVRQPRQDRRVADDDLAGNPSQQAATENDEDREAVEHAQHQLAAEHDQRNANHQAQGDQEQAAVGRGGNGDDIIQGHHRIGDQDRLDRSPHVGFRRDPVPVTLVLGNHQLDPDVQQQEPADELEIRDLQQRDDDQAEDDAEHHGRRAAADDGHLALGIWQRTAGERDHHGVVPGQEDIDSYDLHQVDPEPRGAQFGQHQLIVSIPGPPHSRAPVRNDAASAQPFNQHQFGRIAADGVGDRARVGREVDLSNAAGAAADGSGRAQVPDERPFSRPDVDAE